MGLKYLQKTLNIQLEAHIKDHLPSLMKKFESRLFVCQKELDQYGPVIDENAEAQEYGHALYRMVEAAKTNLRVSFGREYTY